MLWKFNEISQEAMYLIPHVDLKCEKTQFKSYILHTEMFWSINYNSQLKTVLIC